MDAKEFAQRFHDTYERLAPNYGYETRTDTKVFDPDSANGKLMVAVCTEMLTAFKSATPKEFNYDCCGLALNRTEACALGTCFTCSKETVPSPEEK